MQGRRICFWTPPEAASRHQGGGELPSLRASGMPIPGPAPIDPALHQGWARTRGRVAVGDRGIGPGEFTPRLPSDRGPAREKAFRPSSSVSTGLDVVGTRRCLMRGRNAAGWYGARTIAAAVDRVGPTMSGTTNPGRNQSTDGRGPTTRRSSSVHPGMPDDRGRSEHDRRGGGIDPG